MGKISLRSAVIRTTFSVKAISVLRPRDFKTFTRIPIVFESHSFASDSTRPKKAMGMDGER
jgi:hypothetical protein